MNPMHYLFAAYAVIWILLAAYLFSMHSRQKKLLEEVERIKKTLDGMDR